MADTDVVKVNGSDKAAILLMSLGGDVASEVMKHMNPKEVQNVGVTMASLGNVSRPTVESVLDDFIQELQDQTALGIGNEDYIRDVLNKALGDKATNLIDRILMGSESQGLEALKWMDARAVTEIIRLEHPQIIAIVLSYIDPDQAALVLGFLEENKRSDIMMRIAALDGVSPTAIKELDIVLEKNFSESSNMKSSSVGGFKAAAEILNFVETAIEAKVMEEINRDHEDIGTKISDLMFVFDNLIDLDDRGFQALLREVSTDKLVIALKGADDDLAAKFLKNMSQRASEMLQEDMEAQGPLRVSDVEAAQKEILVIARKMEEDGDIMLSSGGADDFI